LSIFKKNVFVYLLYIFFISRGVKVRCKHQCPCKPLRSCDTCRNRRKPVCGADGVTYTNGCWAKCRL